MSQQRIEADYLLETPHDLEATAETMAGEQSSGTFVRVPGETPELRERAAAQVAKLAVLDELIGQRSLPTSHPIARAVGIHEVHYSMVVILAMGLGLFAPPFGVGYYAACAIGRVNPDAGIRPIGGYMLALFVGLVIVAAVPWISIGFL